MICTKCGAEVPDGKLVCDCFLAAVDTEIEARVLTQFAEGQRLFITRAPSSGHHLMPNEGNCLTLCRKKRLGRPETRRIFKDEIAQKVLTLTGGAKPDWCVDCLMKAAGALKDTTQHSASRADLEFGTLGGRA